MRLVSTCSQSFWVTLFFAMRSTSKLLHVPRTLVTPTVVADSRLGSLSSLALRRHCLKSTKRSNAGIGGLEVALVSDNSIGKGNGVGTLASLPIPLTLEWKELSGADGMNSTLPIRLSDIVSFQRDGVGDGGDGKSFALEFRTPLDSSSDTFTFHFTMSTSTSSVFFKSIQYLMRWNRHHEKALLERQGGIVDHPTARKPADIGRLARRASEMGDVTALMHSFCQGHSIDTVVADNGDTILLPACRRGHWDIVNAILLRNATLDPPGASQTAIHAAVEGEGVDLLQVLLDYAATSEGQPYVEALLNCMDESGMTPLHRAVSMGNLSMVRLCIERGANVSSMVESTGQTAVHIAAKTGDLMILSVLLEASDPSLLSFSDLQGFTPLMTAVAAGRHGKNDSSFRRKNIRCMLHLLNASSLVDESFDGSGVLQIARGEGMSGIASIVKDRVRHLRAVKEQADLLNLTGLARNQYRSEQCLQLQKLGGLREGAPAPLQLPLSSSVGTPVVSGGKSAALTTGDLGVGTKERAATKDQPAAKLSSNVPTKMVGGDNAGLPGPSDTARAAVEEEAGDYAGYSTAVDTGVPLKDDEKYSKFFKMMKVKIPVPAIKHKMIQEKKDPAILDLDPEKSLESQKHLLKKSEEGPTKKPIGPKVITGQKTMVTTTPLHWEALPESVLSHPGSLWNSDTNPLLSLEALKVIEGNFEAKGKSMVVVSQAVPAESGQMILSTKWANNTCITMEHFSMAGVANMYDMVHLVSSLSSDSVVTLERAESLSILLQTIDRAEVEAIRDFSGDPADLCRPDRLIHITMKEKNRFLKKLEMFCFVQRYAGVIDELRDKAKKILAACDEICDNDSIERLLLSLLRVGNVMNENSKARSGRAVQAVHLSTLFKAALKKGKSALMMDVAVINLLGWNGDEVLPIAPALECVKIAERIDMEHILQEMEVLQKGIKRITDEITFEKKRRSSERDETGDSFIQNASAFLEDSLPLLEKTQAAVQAAKEKVSAVFASLGLPQSGKKAMKTDELFDTTLKIAAAADASMAKCRNKGRGKKMEDEEVQELQQQHQQQRQRKEQINSNIDRDQSRASETIAPRSHQSERQGSKEMGEETRSLQAAISKIDSQHTDQKEIDVLSAANRHGDGSTGGSTGGSVMGADAKASINTRPERTMSLPSHPADAAPADPRAALLGAIRSRRPDGDGNSKNQAPADPRAALLGAIRSRRPDDDGNAENQAPADPRAALLGAIRSRRPDDDENNDSIGGGTTEEPEADNEDVADELLQAQAAAAAAV